MADLFDLAVASKLSGGGGGSSWTLLHEEDIEISTTSTSAITKKTIHIDGVFAPNDIIVVQIYDKQGWRDGYFYGSEQFAIIPKTGITNFTDLLGRTYYGIDNQGSKGYGSKGWSVTSTAYGVYCQSIHSDDSIAISAKYSANYTKTIDGTYHIEVYKLGFPNNESPFE